MSTFENAAVVRRQEFTCTEEELLIYPNKVLAENEVLYVRMKDGTIRMKMGDGSTRVYDLPYTKVFDASVVNEFGYNKKSAVSQFFATSELKRMNARIDSGGRLRENAPIRYYKSFDAACDDINAEDLSSGAIDISKDAVCSVYYDENHMRYVLILLDDIAVEQKYSFFVPVEINFSGKFFTFANCDKSTRLIFEADAYLNGTTGGGVRATLGSGEAMSDTLYQILLRQTTIVDGGVYSIDGGDRNPGTGCVFYINSTAESVVFKNLKCVINYAGAGRTCGLMFSAAQNLTVDNVDINVAGTDNVDTDFLYGLYHSKNDTKVCVKNSHIEVRAKSRTTATYGIYAAAGELDLIDNEIYVDSAENSADHGTGLGAAVKTNANVFVKGGQYTGVHCALSLYGNLNRIEDSRLVSCAHGGFYQSGENSECYVKNTQLGTVAYQGIFNQSEMGNTVPLGGFYVSGVNCTTYVDNCEYLYTDDTKYVGGVLRGDNDMRLYISNVTVPEGHFLRIDEGNVIYAGEGTNINLKNLCRIYQGAMDPRDYLHEPYRSYRYEDVYANELYSIANKDIDRNTLSIQSIQRRLGIDLFVSKMAITGYNLTAKVSTSIKRYAKILKMYGKYGIMTYDYTDSEDPVRDFPQYILLDGRRVFTFPKAPYYSSTEYRPNDDWIDAIVPSYGYDESNYVYTAGDRWFYHQGGRFHYRYINNETEEDMQEWLLSDEASIKWFKYKGGYFATLKEPIVTDITAALNNQSTFVDLEDVDKIGIWNAGKRMTITTADGKMITAGGLATLELAIAQI